MPPLTVTVMREGRVCILAVGGELDVATAPTLTWHAAAALRQPTGRLIIDLSGLTFIDCSGVRALAAATRAVPPGCPVLVRGADRRIRKILGLLAVTLERPGTTAPGRADWLILDLQVMMSWAQETRAESRALVAAATTRPAPPATGPRAPPGGRTRSSRRRGGAGPSPRPSCPR
jgi:anti-anti-sigma factor